ncbi:MAG: YceD family protein [Burkholderiales bacterium]|nr:YceD family protein [Burkholderiales bacterium]
MSEGGTIDGLEFARTGATRSGVLDPARLPRLKELGCRSAELRYTLRGGTSAQGRPMLLVEAAGALELVCQRCLEALRLPVDVCTELELATSQQEVDAAEDDLDRVLTSRSMPVAELVEDEVILALPMVPMHARCSAAARRGRAARPSPFAGLADMISDRAKR